MNKGFKEYEVDSMVITLQIDNQLVTKAIQLSGHKTKEAAVKQAVIEYIQRLERLNILSVFGTIEYDPDYDYKEQRKKL